MIAARVAMSAFLCLFAMLFSSVPAEAVTMTLRWDPGRESVMGYRVSWGTSSGQYTRTVDVGGNTFFQFEGPTPPTIYYFSVRAYNDAGNESDPSVEVNTGPWPGQLRLVNFSANPTAPQLVGTTVTFQAAADGGIGPYQYKWLIFDGVTWSTGLQWSSSNTFYWRPMVPNAEYRVGVWARSSASTEDEPDNASAQYSVPFAITGESTTSLTIRSGKAAPQPAHTAVKFTANVTGGGTYRYKWWVFDGRAWAVKRDWAPHNTFTWTPAVPNASYRILARAQNVANPMDTAGRSIPFSIVSKDRALPMGPKDSE